MKLNYDDLDILAICAVRYSLGRRSYMPSDVQRILRPRLKEMSPLTLAVILKDLEGASRRPNGYGDEQIDKPGWISFLNDVKDELEHREAELS